ncbi:hypothetical protein DPQ33_17100 [Oceanidesulfovibrio indonesiensis]|uniref:UspA domain-containing protein n=2 Tax=Oceanidesulfovibrio indonesiensis TaxID=54767 RepID=A0A7M3MAC6_9BACT|nr:hypothetical protein DPQ33_17100 [Oceanidesulfovibrio indonesiensis]
MGFCETRLQHNPDSADDPTLFQVFVSNHASRQASRIGMAVAKRGCGSRWKLHESINERELRMVTKQNGKKILVAMDNSEFAQQALSEAIGYAKCSNGTLSVLSVAPILGVLEEMPPGITDKLIAEAQVVVDKAKETVRNAGLEPDGTVRQGASPAEEIVAYIQEYGFDLVIVGNKGKSNLGRFIMGSVAERVAAHAPCSVWIVKQQD